MDFFSSGITLASILTAGGLILKSIALINTSRLERLILSIETNILIRIMQYLVVSLMFSYLITYGCWLLSEEKEFEYYLAIFIVSSIFTFIFILFIFPVFHYFLDKKASKYYINDNNQKLYILKNTHNKKILLSNKPYQNRKGENTFYKIVEVEWLIQKEINEE